jgi:hypothetical protein
VKLIDDCRGPWRHYSTQALAFVASVGVTWHSLPDWVTSQLPGWVAKVVAWGMTLVAVGGLFGKFVSQTPKDAPEDKP